MIKEKAMNWWLAGGVYMALFLISIEFGGTMKNLLNPNSRGC